MRFLASLFTSSFCFLLATSSTIQAEEYSPLSNLPDGSRSSIWVEDLQNQTSWQTLAQNTRFFPPASTLKLATALAAKLELEDDFAFTTELLSNGRDISIRFSGDPTLKTTHLKQLLEAYKQQNGANIRGDLWLDNSVFTGYERAVGWPWDILGVCYSAPSSAITLDENCAQASIYTLADGNTRVYVPEQYPIHVTTNAKTVSKAIQQSNHCDLELLTGDNNQYQLQGCLVERDKPLPLKFAIQDSTQYTSRTLYTLLRQLKIELGGEIKIGVMPNKANVIASHSSATLPELLDTMLKDSDNLIADNLTKAIGARFYLQPGSFANGTEAVKQILYSKAGIDLSRAQLADGSGLSRNNRINPMDMMSILKYIWQHDKELGLVALMPKSGESGTLKYRQSMRSDPVKGQIVAKSGSLYGSYNMAGFVLDQNGQPSAAFIQFITDYYPDKSEESGNVAPITRFEREFYRDLVEFTQVKHN
ncbi:serine-type D-Ala-D-Ala carboxypeptidase [Vibrio vulnificus]|uniref:D-alanyl-D-alanine carboxypeptidase n=1 Tax=Vibrio vulnificus TaxID=672 RepID=A0AAN1PLR8_VIBVL|nr:MULTISPECIES: serine-type D-Ala-D-Ala carboxypeptidase [Vibrio]AXX58905.1 D-alanyl-D-alanine carboxypeptidase [Vibrio vulnificus]EJO9867822.1 serine-type D-Ala-D-Ala carboxypeptidase [Vibrio vulnificus]MCA0764421.1 serine-type D-Ala-D-Ala carboxypeptidase [Vibrio vulnificus]MDC8108611.1 serine-type D-Ala-D-Ala carboxypeptidase [Vibrio sp. CCUG 15886]MDS1862529.1 serine-type D-Ala-D-Ala carboxypeptidase [Vibrio vulnificus]